MALVDIIVVGIIVLSGLIAMYLGFIRVISGLGGWVGAAFATIYGFQYVRPISRQWISEELIADAAAGLAIFVVALILFSFVSHAISRRVKESGLRPVDRSIGLVAGLAVGVILVSGVFLLFDQGTDDPRRPDWLENARSTPLVERTAYFLLSFLPEELRKNASTAGTLTGRNGQNDSKRAINDLLNPKPDKGKAEEKKGYSTKEREEMDRLLQGQK